VSKKKKLPPSGKKEGFMDKHRVRKKGGGLWILSSNEKKERVASAPISDKRKRKKHLGLIDQGWDEVLSTCQRKHTGVCDGRRKRTMEATRQDLSLLRGEEGERASSQMPEDS